MPLIDIHVNIAKETHGKTYSDYIQLLITDHILYI